MLHLLLMGATLIDPKAQKTEVADLLIEDGRVTARAPKIERVPEGTVKVDLHGKFVMPGLLDLHVHSWGNDTVLENGRDDDVGHAAVLARSLYAGVVAVLDLGSDPDVIFPLRDKQRADPDSVPGATLFAAGPVNGSWAMPTPEAAQERIQELIVHHPDVVKLMFDHVGRDPRKGMNSAIFKAAADEAKKAGIKTVVHIGTWDDASKAIENGASCITHLFDSEEIPEKLARRMHELHVVEIPTMAVQGDLYRVTQKPEMLEDPLLKAVTPSWFLPEFKEPLTKWKSRAKQWLEWQKADISVDFTSIRRLKKAGVPLLAGSDAANYATFQGYSAHREIEILAQAGLPIWDAIAAGTTRAAEFLGQRYGVEQGDQAELVVLAASPLENIHNTTRIEALVHQGRYWDQAEREKLKPFMHVIDSSQATKR